jgi:ketosteroid isomerase-like protein
MAALIALGISFAGNQVFAEEKSQLTAEIEEFLAVYAEIYNRQDYASLLQMWDQDDPDPIYMAEEVDPPLQGWARLNAYFNPRPGVQVLDGIRNRYSRVVTRPLGEDLAMATYRLDFEIKVKGMRPMASWDRVIAVFRKRQDGWKLVAYAEAPMAPLTMVRKMLQKDVQEDFGEFIRSPEREKRD